MSGAAPDPSDQNNGAISLPSTSVINSLDEYLITKLGKGLDFDQKEFIAELVCVDTSAQKALHNVSTVNLSSIMKNAWGRVQLDSFAQFWIWFRAVFLVLKHPKILPLWKAGFIHGFVSSEKGKRLLSRKRQAGCFILRFSRRSGGYLILQYFLNNAIEETMISIEKSGFLVGESITLYSTLHDMLSKEFPALKSVLPGRLLDDAEFVAARALISEAVSKERKMLRKESGEFVLERDPSGELSLQKGLLRRKSAGGIPSSTPIPMMTSPLKKKEKPAE